MTYCVFMTSGGTGLLIFKNSLHHANMILLCIFCLDYYEQKQSAHKVRILFPFYITSFSIDIRKAFLTFQRILPGSVLVQWERLFFL